MTSEVVLMNRLAVALAADSAVSIPTGQGHKIFQSANKLFTLSKYHPVGVMIYNNASILGVPWETIIKVYRQKLGNHSMPTVTAYADDFLTFLNDNETLFPQHHQDQAYLDAVKTLFAEIFEAAKRDLFDVLMEDKTPAGIEEYVRAQVLATHLQWSRFDDLDCFALDFQDKHLANYRDRIVGRIGEVFENVPLQQGDTDKLVELALWVATKNQFTEGYSGIVVAGFGEDQIFPAMCSFLTSLVIGNHLKKRSEQSLEIGDDHEAIVKPFAQSDMVKSFTDGIDPNFKRLVARQTMRLAIGLPGTIIDAITDLTDAQKEHWKEKTRGNIEPALDEFFKNMQDHQHKKHTRPVYAAIRSLPKDELAAAAEALVNLNSFRQRVSMDAETVGGPIDVAVISKGDGFIWIKRKHYFDSRLNIHFARNYYRGLDVSDSEEDDNEPKKG